MRDGEICTGWGFSDLSPRSRLAPLGDLLGDIKGPELTLPEHPGLSFAVLPLEDAVKIFNARYRQGLVVDKYEECYKYACLITKLKG